jgi:ElaB/YqjD/DUF883 family membrane-anchored ribosome-binding protein
MCFQEDVIMYTKDNSKHTTNQHTHDLQQDFARVKTKAGETHAALRQTAYDVKEKANELLAKSLRDAKARQVEVQDTVTSYVIENPLKAVGIALLAGVIAAQIFRK